MAILHGLTQQKGDMNTQNILKTADRIVVKIGGATITQSHHDETSIRHDWVKALSADIRDLRQQGKHVIIVSSGAIMLGRHYLNYRHKKTLRLEEKQAAAASGQTLLMRAYEDALSQYNIHGAQILLTLQDTEHRRRHLNARATINELLAHDIVPIVNENDTIATDEIRYGDNDRLAARIATMMGADALVILTDVAGLYDRNPKTHADARHIPTITKIDETIEQMAGAQINPYAHGGMATKIAAAKIAVHGGCHCIIGKGEENHALKNIANNALSTAFIADHKPETARKQWINGTLKPNGKIIIDDGALDALKQGKSLLPAGVKEILGVFERGDVVAVYDTTNHHIASGLIGYDADICQKIKGLKSPQIIDILGDNMRSALIHRDDLSLF